MFEKIKNNFFLLTSTFLILYFIFNLLDGERGLFSHFKKKDLLKNLENKENQLKNEIGNLESKNLLLTDLLDNNTVGSLDYVEILIRKKFLYGKTNETLYIINKNDN